MLARLHSHIIMSKSSFFTRLPIYDEGILLIDSSDWSTSNLTLLHSEQPKLHRVLAILSAEGLRGVIFVSFLLIYF